MPSTTSTSPNRRKTLRRARWKARCFPSPTKQTHRWNVCSWLIPSGSKDPFALRRQANGIIKTIAEHKLPCTCQIMADAREGYEGSEAEKKFTLSGEAYVQAVGASSASAWNFIFAMCSGWPMTW